MKNALLKKSVAIAMALMVLVPAFSLALTANAQPLTGNDLWGNGTIRSNVETGLGLGNRDPREIISTVVRVLLGFLGIIAVLIILYAGFKWMTAGGDEGNIEDAKKMISAGVIGLVIVLAAWGLSTFIIDALVSATS